MREARTWVNGFTFEREVNDSLSPETVSFRKIRIDSKGRVSIPSDLRKSLGLAKGSDVLLGFDLEKGIIFLVCGQGGVVLASRKGGLCITVNMGDCGSPDAGSKVETSRGFPPIQQPVSESPAPDPRKRRGYYVQGE